MKCKKFIIQELVSPEVYKKRGESAWCLINKDLIKTLDTLKEQFPNGTCTINDWKWGGQFKYSGLRSPDSSNYSISSLHTVGMAADCKFNSYDVEEVRQFIINNPDIFPYVKGIEMGTSWLHIDVRNQDKVSLFYP